jgi:hypothetical protein
VVKSRADEWNVNKWAWEGALKVVSKGEECIIKLEDKNTGIILILVLLVNFLFLHHSIELLIQ